MTLSKVPIIAVISATLLPWMALAQDSNTLGYPADITGNLILNSPSAGVCWRASDWLPARAIESCDPVAIEVELPGPNGNVATANSQKSVVRTPQYRHTSRLRGSGFRQMSCSLSAGRC
jgi:hypothetical protein